MAKKTIVDLASQGAPLKTDYVATHRVGDTAAKRLSSEDLVNTVLSAGKAGGRTFAGGDASGESSTWTSTSHSTKGKLFFGSAQTSAYDEANSRWGFGTPSPAAAFHIDGGSSLSGILEYDNSSGNFAEFTFKDASANRWGFGNVSAASTIPSPFYIFQYVDASGSNINAYRFALTNEGNASFFALPTTASWNSGTRCVRLANGGTAPSGNPVDGVFLQVRDTVAGSANLYTVNEADGDRQLTGLIARCTAQFDATTTTLGNVTGLTRNVEAGKFYRFRATLDYDANVTGGHKYAIGGTATATAIRYQVNSIANATGLFVITSRQTALGGSAGQAGSAAGYTEINGYIQVANAGTLTVQFAQNAASGTSSILAGSSFQLFPF